jgi:hypothetical protein
VAEPPFTAESRNGRVTAASLGRLQTSNEGAIVLWGDESSFKARGGLDKDGHPEHLPGPGEHLNYGDH